MQYTEVDDASFTAPAGKTALIAAAGPSLDKAILYIKKKRNDFYIVATDTAYRSFSKRGIGCDAVVSIDGQILSAEHFFSETERYRTLFIFTCALIRAQCVLLKNPAAKSPSFKQVFRLPSTHRGFRNAKRVYLFRTLRRERSRSEERRVGKECRSRWSPYH